MTTLLLDPLRPELIGGLFGRKPSLAESTVFKNLQPRYRFDLISVVVAATVLVLAAIDGGLTNSRGVPTTLILVVHPVKVIHQVGLPLLQDPVGLIAIAMTLLTPVFCAEQVRAIHGFVTMNERNITYRIDTLDHGKVNHLVAQANAQFNIIGSRRVWILLLATSGLLSYLLDLLIRRWGLFTSWNYTSLSNHAWRTKVYAGWWANPDSNLMLAIMLWCLGCYFFYFLIKQLAMGFVFAIFARRAMRFNFGVSPNMSANTDGYWGLRLLRQFMQITYVSMLGHFIIILGIFAVWLPLGTFTVLLLSGVVVVNWSVVVYPSVVAHAGSVNEKTCFVAHLLRSPDTAQTGDDDRSMVIDKVWGSPNLPFRVRSTLTAGTIYLLVPLLLALVSSLLDR